MAKTRQFGDHLDAFNIGVFVLFILIVIIVIYILMTTKVTSL